MVQASYRNCLKSVQPRIYSSLDRSLKHCWIFFRRYSATMFFLLLYLLISCLESANETKEAGNFREGNFLIRFYHIIRYLPVINL